MSDLYSDKCNGCEMLKDCLAEGFLCAPENVAKYTQEANETNEENDRVCANCQHCKQFFTGDDYPEFGCLSRETLSIKYDASYFPSTTEGCEHWEYNRRSLWTD